jgi:malic enzyme
VVGNLLDHNETLFYRTVMSDPARFLPIVYDPTIAEACLKFGHIVAFIREHVYKPEYSKPAAGVSKAA